MAVDFSKSRLTQSLFGKVVLALLLAAIAIFLSWSITQVTFRHVLNTVNQLSVTNPRLELVNRLFINVVKLEQLQRMQSLEPKAEEQQALLSESANVRLMLDSLHAMSLADTQQVNLVVSMKALLQQRDELYINYLATQSDYIKNDVLNKNIQSLKKIVRNPVYNIDSNIITTQSQKTVTTTILPAEDRTISNKSLWNKVFGKKKTGQPKQQVKEEVNIITDTMKLSNVDTAIIRLSETIANAEIRRTHKSRELIDRQLELYKTGNIFITRLLDILYKIEQEETEYVEQKNAAATAMVNRNLWRMNILIIIFIAGAAVITFLILTDIIKSNRYKKELIQAKEEAEELGQVKQRFLANMSHELRTPLQAIVGMAEQVKIKGEAGGNDINMIYQSSQHLLQIVNEILDYSHITSGKFRLEEKVFNIADTLDEVKNVMQVKAAEHHLPLIYHPMLTPGMNHFGDPFRLKQLLYNLLGNAVKFTEEGSVTLLAQQKDFSTYSVLTITVQDTGCGIPQDDIDKIFNQFEQGGAPANMQQQGTGLGLSIVQTLLNTLKGTIHVASEQGKGSVFTISVPYTIAREEQGTIKKQEQLTLAIKEEIWVIDDDPLILQLCDLLLKKHRLQYKCYSDPQAFINDCKISPPGIILMDIRMPVITGFELLTKIKPFISAATKVYALTAHALPANRNEILTAGFTDMLMKPFMETQLLSLLGAHSNSTAAVVDKFDNGFEELRKITGGDEELLRNILRQFIEETERDNELLELSTELHNLPQAAEQLHRMAGRLGQIGMKTIAKELRTVEIEIRNNNSPDIIPRLNKLFHDVQQAITVVKDYLS